MSVRGKRYVASREPHHDRHARPADGFDAVLFNGVELGGKERARLRKEVARVKQREEAWAALAGED